MNADWVLCWWIDLDFHEKLEKNTLCDICGRLVQNQSFVSTFIYKAASCWRHGPCFLKSDNSCVCSFCNKDLSLKITLRKQKCFNSDCECFLRVDKGAVCDKVGNTDRLNEYVSLWMGISTPFEMADQCCYMISLAGTSHFSKNINLFTVYSVWTMSPSTVFRILRQPKTANTTSIFALTAYRAS